MWRPLILPIAFALIRINQLYRSGIDGNSLYRTTRTWWVVDPERGAEWGSTP